MAPYEKWQYYDTKVQQQEQDHNYALNKTKKVAWFVSNCGARNGRLHYAHELQKHIEVITPGHCKVTGDTRISQVLDKLEGLSCVISNGLVSLLYIYMCIV